MLRASRSVRPRAATYHAGDEEACQAGRVTAEQSHLADWLLREASDSGEPEVIAASAERSFHSLCTRLMELATPSGCQALLNRAIRLAAGEFPFLLGVRAGLLPGECLEGVQESGQGVTSEHLKAGLIALMAQFIDLLELFVGETLMVHLIRQVWPDAPLSMDTTQSTGQDASL
jgi:hypothetical protein